MSRKSWSYDKLFSRLLNNLSEATYWDNIRELRSRPGEQVFFRSKVLTNSSNAKERRIGIDVLAQLGSPPRPILKSQGKYSSNS